MTKQTPGQLQIQTDVWKHNTQKTGRLNLTSEHWLSRGGGGSGGPPILIGDRSWDLHKNVEKLSG